MDYGWKAPRHLKTTYKDALEMFEFKFHDVV